MDEITERFKLSYRVRAIIQSNRAELITLIPGIKARKKAARTRNRPIVHLNYLRQRAFHDSKPI